MDNRLLLRQKNGSG